MMPTLEWMNWFLSGLNGLSLRVLPQPQQLTLPFGLKGTPQHNMNKSQVNHNPLNLRFAHQREATGQDDKGFAIFPTAPAGWRAAHAQIKKDAERGITLNNFIFKFAPPNENDTNAYLEFVIKNIDNEGTLIDCPLRNINRFALAGVMAQFEGYYNV